MLDAKGEHSTITKCDCKCPVGHTLVMCKQAVRWLVTVHVYSVHSSPYP